MLLCIDQGFTFKVGNRKWKIIAAVWIWDISIGNLFSSFFSIGTRFFSSHWFRQNWWSLRSTWPAEPRSVSRVSDEFPFCCTWLDLQERGAKIRWPMISSRSHFHRLLTVISFDVLHLLLFIAHFCHLSPSLSVFWKAWLWHFWESFSFAPSKKSQTSIFQKMIGELSYSNCR